jgi:hypothetical protein
MSFIWLQKVFCLALFAIPHALTVYPMSAATTSCSDNAPLLNLFAMASTNPAVLCGMN